MMDNIATCISELRRPTGKNEKFFVSEFLIKENNITKLFLMRLQIYGDICRGFVVHDESKIKKIVYLPYMQDTLIYKLALSYDLSELMRLNNVSPQSREFQSYMNTLILSANDKSILYSILDDRLFCYYIWAHTLQTKKKEITGGWYFASDGNIFSEFINTIAFKDKIGMFHEQRKLIIIFELELNIEQRFSIQSIKHNWQQICRNGPIVELNENNHEFVEWVLQYTINFIQTDKVYNGSNIEISSLFYQQMVTIKDKIETCYTLINTYIFSEKSYRNEFKKKINLAITQQERRNRVKSKQSAIKLSTKHEEKLKNLAKYQRIPKKHILENLIDSYYDKLGIK